MIKMTFAALLLVMFTLLSGPCFATKIAPATVAELVQHSDYVAMVVIIESEVVYNSGGKLCGYRYTAAVLDAMKGAIGAGMLEWNTKVGFNNDILAAGTKYIVFLTNKDRQFDPLYSTNSAAEREQALFDRACGADLNSKRVVHRGHGVLLVVSPCEECDPAVRVPGIIALPEKFETKPFPGKDVEECEFYSLANLQEMISYIKSLLP
jgi:hypothetical protein